MRADGDAFGRGEGFDVGVLGELDGAVHELGPDGSGGVGALERVVLRYRCSRRCLPR